MPICSNSSLSSNPCRTLCIAAIFLLVKTAKSWNCVQRNGGLFFHFILVYPLIDWFSIQKRSTENKKMIHICKIKLG